MDVPRLAARNVGEEVVEKAIKYAFSELRYTAATNDQQTAITEFVLGRDVFVSLPTGSGKSLCFATLPYVFDYLRHSLVPGNLVIKKSSICIVVSPLISLMKDQVGKFSERGLRSAYVGEEQKDAALKSAVVSGEYQLVYMSPESLLCVLQWREMFRMEVYQENLIAIVVDEAHCVEQWGGSFREEFGNIGEARSIIPRGVNVMALTATATRATREFVQRSLCMSNCCVILKPPNKLNIKYTVQCKPDDPAVVPKPIIEDVAARGSAADKTVVFCPTYSDCSTMFEVLVDELGQHDCLHIDGSDITVCNIFTAATDAKVKDTILTEFVKPSTPLRIVVATIAFGMGLDAPNIRRTIHWGPSRSIEAYVQESGCCGRDGVNAVAELYFTGKDFSGTFGPTESMKDYCKNVSTCRRQQLLEHFDTLGSILKPIQDHDCCDVCAFKCDCVDCSNKQCHIDEAQSEISTLTPAQKRMITARIKQYHSQCCPMDHCMLFGIEIVSGIPDCIIEIILSNASTCTVGYLQNLGIPVNHAIVICEIVCNILDSV